jgi:hypothetical protein
MKNLKKLLNSIKNKGFAQTCLYSSKYLLQRPLYPFLSKTISDKRHEKIVSTLALGYVPQIDNPRSFNEKILNRKLSSSKTDLFSYVSDKHRVRDYVKNKIGESILTNVYYVGDNPDEIDFNNLPNQFVMKATHGSGWTIVVNNKQETNFEKLRSTCHDWLRQSYGRISKEYWYQEIEPQIIIEEYIEDTDRKVPLDYKMYVFDGNVEYIHVDHDRFAGEHTRRFFDTDWNALDFTLEYPLGPKINKPTRLGEMIEIASILGEEFEFARVDLYHTSDNEIYFGEITLAPGGGTERFNPISKDFKLGSYW